jgi:chemotaxis response regulator CheB
VICLSSLVYGLRPGDYDMVVKEEGHRIRLGTHHRPRENICRLSVDVLLRSVAAI